MYNDFFKQHLIDTVQEEYGLDEEEIVKLISYLEKFENDPKDALRKARKKKNKKSLDNLIRLVLNKELEQKQSLEYKRGPVTPNDSFVIPIGIPLNIP